MQGNPLVPLVMFGWLPLVLFLFSQYPAQRALLTSFIIAWLVLPQASLALPFIPDYSRINATCYGVLIATLVFDISRFSTLRLSWIDIPMIVWCCCPFLTSIDNDLGWYDGSIMLLDQTWTWGLPYFLGRIYLNTFQALRNLAIAVFFGGLAYVPFCIIESRLSLSTHLLVYGFQHPSQSFLISLRFGGYRPSVFLESGLMLGVWLMSAAMMGIVLWRTKNLPSHFRGIPTGILVGAVIFAFAIQRATGAYLLFVFGLLILFVARWARSAIMLWVLYGMIIFFLVYAVSGEFPRREIIDAMSQVFPPDRVQSVDFRFMNEELLGDHARKRIIFGWGGFGRNRLFDEYGKDITITDSLWIIVFGVNGLVGLISCFSALMVPTFCFVMRYPAKLWSNPVVAPAAALSVSVILYVFDCVLNAMVNPIFALTCGAIAGVTINANPLAVPKRRRLSTQQISGAPT
jgi:hypothetical protein